MTGPIYHGSSHSPVGADPHMIEEPHFVGASGEPPFLHSCSNATPTGAIPDPTPLQFYLTVGAPNLIDSDGVTILDYVYHELVIVGDVVVPPESSGLSIFTLPVTHRFPTDRPFVGHDEYGGFVSGRLFKNGDFCRGTA